MARTRLAYKFSEGERGQKIVLYVQRANGDIVRKRARRKPDGSVTVQGMKRTWLVPENSLRRTPTRPAELGLTLGRFPSALVHEDAALAINVHSEGYAPVADAKDAATFAGMITRAVSTANGSRPPFGLPRYEWDTSHELNEFKNTKLTESLIRATEKDPDQDNTRMLIYLAAGALGFSVLIVLFVLYSLGLLDGSILAPAR